MQPRARKAHAVSRSEVAHAQRRRTWAACLCALGLSTAAVSVALPAHAKDTPARKGSSKKEDKNVLAAQALLNSSDRDQVEAGIQSLGLIGTAAAAPPIIA